VAHSTWASTMTRMTRSGTRWPRESPCSLPEGGNETRYPGVSLYRFHGPGAAYTLCLSSSWFWWGRKEQVSRQQDASV